MGLWNSGIVFCRELGSYDRKLEIKSFEIGNLDPVMHIKQSVQQIGGKPYQKLSI